MMEVGSIPGSIEGNIAPFIPRYLEGQSAVSIQHVSCGDLFTACLTGGKFTKNIFNKTK